MLRPHPASLPPVQPSRRVEHLFACAGEQMCMPARDFDAGVGVEWQLLFSPKRPPNDTKNVQNVIYPGPSALIFVVVPNMQLCATVGHFCSFIFCLCRALLRMCSDCGEEVVPVSSMNPPRE